MNHSSRVVRCGQPFCPFDAYGFSDTSNWSLYACHREMCGSPEFQGCMWLTPAYALAVLEKILCWCCPISNPCIKKYFFLITLFSEWYCRGVGGGEWWLGFYSELGCPFSCGFLEERNRLFILLRLSEQKLLEHVLKIYFTDSYIAEITLF